MRLKTREILSVLFATVCAILLAITPLTQTFAQLLENSVNPIRDDLKIKAPKNRLIGQRSYGEEDIKYVYRLDSNVSTNASAEIQKIASSRGLTVASEVIGNRTKNSRTFETNVKDIYVTEIISGEPQYYNDENELW